MSTAINTIVHHLQHAEVVQAKVRSDGQLQRLWQLKEWQCNRLLASHLDLWEVPRFQPAMTFFIDELYGPKDFSQRDAELATVLPKMQKLLPASALESLAVAIHLNSLSQDLDVQLLHCLGTEPLNAETYARAYCACANPVQRTTQLDFIAELAADLGKVVNISGISVMLRISRTPAKKMGVEALQTLLESGFNAFRRLGNADDFVLPIVNRERAIMDDLFAGKQVLPNV